MYNFYIDGGKNLKDIDKVNEIFLKRGNWKIYNNEKKINFAYFKNIYDKNNWSKITSFNNSLKNFKEIFNKGIIVKKIKNISLKIDKYLFHQININVKKFKNYDKVNFENIKFFKPVGGGGGMGIKLITNKEELKKHINKIKKDKTITNNWILQDYHINEIMTFKGYKFHFRVHFIIGNTKNKVVKSFIHDKFPVALAKEKFDKNNMNLKVHDTHYKHNKREIFLDEIFDKKDYKKILKQLEELFSVFKEIFNVICYDETKYCYKIFGADILVNKDLSIKLIEMNTNPSFNFNDWLYEILEGVVYHYVDEVFPPENKIKKFKNFISV